MNIITPFRNASLLTTPNDQKFELIQDFLMNDPSMVERLGIMTALGIGTIVVCNNMISSRLCYVEGELYFRNVRCKKSNPWIKDSKYYAGLLTWFRKSCQFYDMTTEDVRKVIQFCLYSSLIPEKTKYEFEAMLKP